jgi:hypothetical protein
MREKRKRRKLVEGYGGNVIYSGGREREMDEWMNAGVGREARPDKVDGEKGNRRLW